MLATTGQTISVVGIDIGKNSFHVVGLDDRGAIVLRQKWSRGQVHDLPICRPA
jgi:transposase